VAKKMTWQARESSQRARRPKNVRAQWVPRRRVCDAV